MTVGGATHRPALPPLYATCVELGEIGYLRMYGLDS
jgi:hypothetical protein